MLYQKIDTIFERDPKTFKVTPIFKNPIFGIPRKWEWTEKIDGTNIRLIKNNNELSLGGRTEKSKVPKEIEEYLFYSICGYQMREIFGDKDVIIYGEGYGGKIQSGQQDKERGGKYKETESFIVFDILVGGKYWLKRENMIDICEKLNLDVVPCLGYFSFEEAVKMVHKGFTSEIAPVKSEGLVGRTHIPLFDSKHQRLICKIKTKDF